MIGLLIKHEYFKKKNLKTSIEIKKQEKQNQLQDIGGDEAIFCFEKTVFVVVVVVFCNFSLWFFYLADLHPCKMFIID